MYSSEYWYDYLTGIGFEKEDSQTIQDFYWVNGMSVQVIAHSMTERRDRANVFFYVGRDNLLIHLFIDQISTNPVHTRYRKPVKEGIEEYKLLFKAIADPELLPLCLDLEWAAPIVDYLLRTHV